MKTTITEFVQIRTFETTTDNQLFDRADAVVNFLKNQDGCLDAELVKGPTGTTWCFIFHYENMEKVKDIAEKMRSCEEFEALKSLLLPGSLEVSFFSQQKKW